MKTFQTAAEAIEHSSRHNEWTECENTPENIDHLLVECDDHNDMMDFWADDETEAGMIWRVKVAS